MISGHQEALFGQHLSAVEVEMGRVCAEEKKVT